MIRGFYGLLISISKNRYPWSYDKKIISNLDRQTAANSLSGSVAQLALARAELKNARNNLSYTVVKSPVDGKIGTLPYKVGALVSPQIETALTTVSNKSNIYAYFSMTENEILSLVKKSGSQERATEDMPLVELALSDGTTYKHKGRIYNNIGIRIGLTF